MKYAFPIIMVLLGVSLFTPSSVDCVSAASCDNDTSGDYHSWCNSTAIPRLCESIVESDPRAGLKSSPQGLVVILVNAAEAQANTLSLFINDTLQNHTIDDKSKEFIKGCVLADYPDWVKHKLQDVNIGKVSDKDHCGDLNFALHDAFIEVNYDCTPTPTSTGPTLDQMSKFVQSFGSLLLAAQKILISLIGCN